MEKAYDLKELGKRLKEKGLVVVEDGAELTYKEVMGWLKDSAIQSTTKLDDLVLPFVGKIDELVLPQIDKIDGVQGQ